jgi:hypothetical protein
MTTIQESVSTPDVGTMPRKVKAAPSLKRALELRKKKEAGSLRHQIDVMKAAGVPDPEIEAYIRKEFAKRDEDRVRREAAEKLGTPP